MTRIFAPEQIASWLDRNEYHPQSDKDGKAICQYFAEDLAHVSDPIKDAYQSSELVYAIDHDVGPGELKWDVDLVIGPPAEPVQQTLKIDADADNDDGIAVEGTPEEVWVAVDAKAVMTAHQKAQKNRARNVFSLAATLSELAQIEDVTPRVHPESLTTGIAVVNMSDEFVNPVHPDSINTHDRIEQTAERTFDLFQQTAADLDAIYGIGCIGVDHTNMDGDVSKLVTDPPAPQSGESTHYGTFLEDVADAVETRFL